VAIHVERQRQAVFGEGHGQQIEVAQEQFALVEAGAGDDARAVVDQIQQRVLEGRAWEPRMGGGVQLPQLSDGLPLPALDGGLGARGAGVDRQVVLVRPPAHLGSCQLPAQAPVHLAGGETVGGGRTGGEQFAQEFLDRGEPSGAMIAPRRLGGPPRLLTSRTSAQILVVELVTATARNPQLLGHGDDRKVFGAKPSQQVADERNPVPMDQLTMSFCIPPAWGLCPQTPKVFRFPTGLRTLPAWATRTP